MAVETMTEVIKSLYPGNRSQEMKKKILLYCTADSTDGSFSLPLSEGLVEHLDGYFLYKVTAYPGITAPTTDSDLAITATTAKLAFDGGGTTALTVGELITGGTSGATGLITSIVLSSGTWAGGDAAGSVTLRKRNNIAFQNNDVLTGSTSGGTADATGADTTNKTINILGDNGTDLVDNTDTREVTCELITGAVGFFPIVDRDNVYTVAVTNNAVNSATFVIELMLTQ
jgi:hypothetical protein